MAGVRRAPGTVNSYDPGSRRQGLGRRETTEYRCGVSQCAYETGQNTARYKGPGRQGGHGTELAVGHMCTHEIRTDSRHVQSYVSSLVVKNGLLESFLQRGICNLVLRQAHLFHLRV